jgi:hypothetical protein
VPPLAQSAQGDAEEPGGASLIGAGLGEGAGDALALQAVEVVVQIGLGAVRRDRDRFRGRRPSAGSPGGARAACAKDFCGTWITIDAVAQTLSVDVAEEALARRRAEWAPPPYKATRGTLYKYIKNVKTASEGCVTDE